MIVDPIYSERLSLVTATPNLVRAAIAGSSSLQVALGATVPATWPHDYLDVAAFEFFLRKAEEHRDQAGWWLRFVILRAEHGGPLLVGSAGYKGPPTPGGLVEFGYGIVSDQRRKGYASETVRALTKRAFMLPEVKTLAAETLPDLAGSIAVLEGCGFTRVEGQDEMKPLRFELTRSTYLRASAYGGLP